MRYLAVLLTIVMVGCDSTNTDASSEPERITYRIESHGESGIRAIEFIPENGDSLGLDVSPTPNWEMEIPWFEGPKGFSVISRGDHFTLSILKGDDVIASTEVSDTGNQAEWSIGVIADAVGLPSQFIVSGEKELRFSENGTPEVLFDHIDMEKPISKYLEVVSYNTPGPLMYSYIHKNSALRLISSQPPVQVPFRMWQK